MVGITAKARNKQREVGQCLDGADVGNMRDSYYTENEDISLFLFRVTWVLQPIPKGSQRFPDTLLLTMMLTVVGLAAFSFKSGSTYTFVTELL